jgi:transcriptional regulator with XRE-family HTH domain
MTPELAFASVLREVRGARGLSQEKLGFESGYHRTYISMLERGMMNPSLRTILQIGSALQMTGAEIVAKVEGVLGSSGTDWKRS